MKYVAAIRFGYGDKIFDAGEAVTLEGESLKLALAKGWARRVVDTAPVTQPPATTAPVTQPPAPAAPATQPPAVQ